MKYFIIILSFFLTHLCYSQTFINRAGPANTVQDDKLAAKNAFYLPRLNDTAFVSGALDSIGLLIYDRLRAKVWIRDTVLTGGHKWNGIGENISNTSLTANGNYAQNWNSKQLWIDSISSAFQIRSGGVGTTGTRRKEFKIAWGTSFADNLDGWRIVSVIRNGASTTDSIYAGMVSSGNGVLSAGIFNTAIGSTFISYNTGGLININAKDSIWIKGAVVAATADSFLGVEDRGNGLSKIKKIPLTATITSPGGSNTQVQFNDGGTFGGDGGFTYNKTSNTVTTDSILNMETRSDWVTLNQGGAVDSLNTYGNSITAGNNASPADSAYANRMGAQLNVPLHNYAISGRGVQTAIYLHFLNTSLLHNSITSVMAGFNDIRNNNILSGLSGRRTQNKCINSHKSIITNHLLKSFISLSGASITRYGSWAINFPANSEGGKTATGIYTSSTNDSLTYVFTDSTVVVGLIGQDNISQNGSNYTMYIDGSSVLTGTTSDQSDGIDDGSGFGGDRIPMAEIITGLTYGVHTLKIVNNGSGFFILDYIGHLRNASTAPVMLIFDAPYMNAAGYAATPNSSIAATDTLNSRYDSLRNALPIPYKNLISVVHTNICYDTLTGLSGDNVHPNNVGHGQIFTCSLPYLQGGIKPEGSLFYASGNLYFNDAIESTKVILGAGNSNYIPKFSATNKLANSIIQDDGTNIGINQTPATYRLSVTGTLRTTADAYFATSSGSVGIGTTSPSYKLDINGTVGATGAITSQGNGSGFNLTSRSNQSIAWSIYSDDNALKFYSTANNTDRIKFWHRGAITIAKVGETSAIDEYRALAVHGSVSISKDSIPIITSMGTNYLLAIDTASTSDSNRIKRILPSSLYTFTNGLTNTSGTVKWGGTLTADTRISMGTNAVRFSTPDLDMLTLSPSTNAISFDASNPITSDISTFLFQSLAGVSTMTMVAQESSSGNTIGIQGTASSSLARIDYTALNHIFSGNATFGTTNSIVGTATNNDAIAGNIGEEINHYTTTYTNYTTTATYQAIDSITLTAGDWDIDAFATFSSNSATITAASNAIFVISTTRASASGATEGKNISYVPQATLLGTSFESITIAPYRVSLSSTTKYYLNSQATFTIGNPQFVGGIRARRCR